jgi:hypothetical protein
MQLILDAARAGIEDMRNALQEKVADKLKNRGKQRMRPKMGRMDIDYHLMQEAFFKKQHKPPLTSLGDLYYEGALFSFPLNTLINADQHRAGHKPPVTSNILLCYSACLALFVLHRRQTTTDPTASSHTHQEAPSFAFGAFVCRKLAIFTLLAALSRPHCMGIVVTAAGKEYEMKASKAFPGVLSLEMKAALGMSELAPPPWLINMQRYGPPPSYPSLKIPGLNSPLPPGAEFGYHPGGWGKPPVDQDGQPLYGDVFGMHVEPDNDLDIQVCGPVCWLPSCCLIGSLRVLPHVV